MIKIYNENHELVAEVSREDYLEFGITETGHYAIVDGDDYAEAVDIGCLNAFYLTKPPEWENHLAKCEGVGQHEQNLGRCYNRYYCPLCGITYTVDSSD